MKTSKELELFESVKSVDMRFLRIHDHCAPGCRVKLVAAAGSLYSGNVEQHPGGCSLRLVRFKLDQTTLVEFRVAQGVGALWQSGPATVLDACFQH
eukprot:scaffold4291_cov256-Pinguiococcus_pyrenoidosus.AAC.1